MKLLYALYKNLITPISIVAAKLLSSSGMCNQAPFSTSVQFYSSIKIYSVRLQAILLNMYCVPYNI